ncbi:Spy/CpxP family protein refolding chaperone [Phormidium tenue FACHB-886]|nr:Spy/CpxP family protein refolding chaperone [Phormidium tenue FACHB-886]
MKFNLKAIWISGAVLGAIALIPILVKAQSALPELARLSQQINLTTEQRDQLQQMRQDTRAQLEALLTAEQNQQLQTALANGTPLWEAIESLNLTEAQSAQGQEILQAAHAERQSVLTPEQQQELRQNRRARWQQLLTGDGQIPEEISQRLNLTADQQTQLLQIRQDARTQLEALLTPEQRSQVQTALAQGDALPTLIQSLNLTESQRTQGWQILGNSRQQAESVLTAEQEQRIRQFFRDRSL